MKNYTKRHAWFLLTILKRSLSLILGKIFCLSVFPHWQTWSSGLGLKGFCPGQMVEHKNPADSRNNLKKREEISLNWYGGAKINGYSGSLEKTLLHFFTTEISDAIDQTAYWETWVRIQRGWAESSSLWSWLLSCHVTRAGEGAEVALDRSHLCSLWTDLGFDRLKMVPADRAGVGGVRACAQSSPSTVAKRKCTWTILDQQQRLWKTILAKSQSKRREQ